MVVVVIWRVYILKKIESRYRESDLYKLKVSKVNPLENIPLGFHYKKRDRLTI